MSYRNEERIRDCGEAAPLRAPVLLKPLSDVYVQRGDAIELKCLVDSMPEAQVVWYKDSRVVNSAPGSPYRLDTANGICRLAVREAYAEDAGLYRCVATNHLGAVSSEALVCVAGEK